MFEGVRLYFTNHARERMAEAGIGMGKAVWMFHNSVPEKPLHLSEYRNQKHDDEKSRYFRNGTVIFVVQQLSEKKILVITVCDQRITAPINYNQDKYSHRQAERRGYEKEKNEENY